MSVERDPCHLEVPSESAMECLSQELENKNLEFQKLKKVKNDLVQRHHTKITYRYLAEGSKS